MSTSVHSNDRATRRLLAVLGLLGTFLTAGCEDDDAPSAQATADGGAVATPDAGTPDASAADVGQAQGPESWIVGGWLSTDDSYTGFLTIADDLSANGRIDLGQAQEFPGDMMYASPGGGVVFVGLEGKPVVERWSIADKKLQKDGEVSFANFAVTETLGGGRNVLQFLDAERAFYFDNENLQVIVFNPTKLETVEAFSFKGLEQPGTEMAMNFVHRDGDRFIVTARYWSLADETTTPLVRAAIIDANSKAVSYIDDTRCGNVAFHATDAEGNVYYGSHPGQAVAIAAGTAGANPTPPCMLRIKKGASEFDKSYFVNLAELTGGTTGGLMQGSDGHAYVFTYTGSGITPDNERATLRSEDWAVYGLKLGEEKSTYAKVEGIGGIAPYGDAFSTRVNGKNTPYVVGVKGDFSEGRYYDISDPKRATPALSFPGYPGPAYAVR